MPSAEPYQVLAAAVREQRKALGLTQRELSELSGCGLVFIYDLEHAKPTMQLDKVLDVLHVLGLQFVIEAGKNRLARRSAPQQ